MLCSQQGGKVLIRLRRVRVQIYKSERSALQASVIQVTATLKIFELATAGPPDRQPGTWAAA